MCQSKWTITHDIKHYQAAYTRQDLFRATRALGSSSCVGCSKFKIEVVNYCNRHVPLNLPFRSLDLEAKDKQCEFYLEFSTVQMEDSLSLFSNHKSTCKGFGKC